MISDRTNSTYGSKSNDQTAKPANLANDNVVVLGILNGISGEPSDPTPPTDFLPVPGPTWPIEATSGGFNVELRVYYKPIIDAGSEPANYAFVHSAMSSQVWAVRVSDVDPADPIMAAAGQSSLGATSTFSSVTTDLADADVLACHFDWGNSTNNLAGPSAGDPTFSTELLDTVISGLWYGVKATPGATGARTMTNNAGAEGWGTVVIAFNPLVGPPPQVALPTGDVATSGWSGDFEDLADESDGTLNEATLAV